MATVPGSLLKPGDQISGRYILSEIIGHGGMGVVWRAHDRLENRTVAFKTIAHSPAKKNPSTDRFLRETKIATTLQHPSVVRVLDSGYTSHGDPFMVLEYLQGSSLAERLKKTPALSISQLIHCIAGILDGLALVHAAGVIHRDIKPQNIFIVDGDPVQAKLLDFGASSAGILDDVSGAITATGETLGTPQYMSPEQLCDSHSVDQRADVFSVGALLYECLAGVRPFRGATVGALLMSVLREQPPPLLDINPDVGSHLAQVIERALNKERNDRYSSALVMRAELLAALDMVPPHALLPSPKSSSLVPVLGEEHLPEISTHTMPALYKDETGYSDLPSTLSEPNNGAGAIPSEEPIDSVLRDDTPNPDIPAVAIPTTPLRLPTTLAPQMAAKSMTSTELPVALNLTNSDPERLRWAVAVAVAALLVVLLSVWVLFSE